LRQTGWIAAVEGKRVGCVLYLGRGFVLTHKEPHHSFGVDLVGQTYEVDLTGAGNSLASAEPR
jgi:hypothetical protein